MMDGGVKNKSIVGKRSILVLVSLAIVLSGTRTDIIAGPRYKTIDLGTLGGTQSWASAINNLGQVVGTSRTVSGDYRAFLWQDTNANGECDPGEMQDLGTLGGNTSLATAINNIGQVVGSSATAGGKYHAFLWDSNSGMIDLGTLNGNRFSHATGINDSGQAVGYSADSTEPDIDNVAFLWDSVDGMVELLPSLPSPPPYPVTSKATGINNSGQVVGTLRTYYDVWGELITKTAAFLWDSNDGPKLLGTLGGEWDDSSNANAINNMGQVVGGSTTDEPHRYRAFIWDENTGMINLGTVAEMWTSVGYGINDAGCVVGHCHNNMLPGPEEAFMWDSVNGMIALSYQLPGYSDWQKLRIAYGVNNLGQVVGSGLTKSQQDHAFVMTPLAEPSTTHLVPAEYPTIQAAINAAWAGDTVIVAPGTYSGSGNRDIDFKGKAITVKSTEPNDAAVVAATVIDCNGSFGDAHRGFYFHSGEEGDSVVEGVTIINGYSHEGGGGIYCNGSSPTISKCIISNNESRYAAGGIYCFDSSPTITDCTVSGNAGAGVSCVAGSRPTISNCTIRDNSGSGIVGVGIIRGCTITGNTTTGSGGGIYCFGGTISNCIISGNVAKTEAGSHGYGGGGIYCDQPNSPVISNCVITGNRSGEWGGGICADWKDANLIITNCIIANNVAEEDGGGVANCGGTITNCVIVRNRAEGARYYEGLGGGLYMYDGAVINCTIVGNRAGEGGGGLSYCSGSVTNCIIWDNGAGQIHESGTVTYSNVEGGWEGAGNIDAEPGFALEGDYHIMPGSACIDAGANDPCGGLTETDLDGVSRRLDGDGDGSAVCDMGAYEFDPNSPRIAVSGRSFYFAQDWPGHEPQTLLIRNYGGEELNSQVVEDCNWLQVDPGNGATDGEIVELSLTVDANGLAPGLYEYTFTLWDPSSPDSQISITVTLPVGWVLQVPSTAYPTIQAAIDAASDYDVVVVADGNYTGGGNKDLDFGGKAITVKSENGADSCVIDCENSGNGFNFESGEEADSVVDGFTIANGGHGVWCREGSPTIRNCSVTNNSDGGIVSRWPSSPRVIGCTITGNTGGYDVAGGITYGYHGPSGSSTAEVVDCVVSNNAGVGISCGRAIATIENCTVSGNSSPSGRGGAISCFGETSITNCVISDNVMSGVWCGGYTKISKCRIIGNRPDVFSEKGGGIYFQGGRLTIRDCEVSGNSAFRGGGGIYCENGGLKIFNSEIRGNVSKSGDGGGICVEDSSSGGLALINCVVSGNIGDGGGGGIYYDSDFGLTLANCTVSGNIALRHGGGILCGGGDMGVINSIFWGNEAPYGPQMHISGYSDTSVSYSDVQGGVNDLHIGAGGNVDWGAGNIDVDPRFALIGDCHLMWGSPCIDAGTNNTVGGLPSEDAEGVVRPLDGDGDGNSVADMGAYEFSLEDSTIAVSSRRFYSVQDWPEREPQTLSIRNCGGKELNWEVVEDCNWLEVTPASGASLDEVDEVTIKVEPNGLEPGLYRCTLTVKEGGASNSPVEILVEMPVGELLWVPSGEFGTIQEAIDTANDYDVVVVQDGIYSGEGNRALELHGKAITVRSVNGPNECIIDCNDADHGLNLRRNEGWSSVIDGFTIMDANVGIRCYPSSPLIRNCIVTGSYHSGVQCRSSVVRIENSTITGSRGDAESAGIRCMRSSPRITGCTISSNNGAGIYDEGDSWVVVSSCSVCYNSGGGIYCEGGLVIENSTIRGNMAEVMGGGIRSRSTRMRGCTITGNSAPYFGGIISDGRLVTIENCVISDNTAYDAVGGVFFGNPYNKGHVMTNCLIAGNKSLGYGIGGVGCMGGTISNCTIVGNWALNLGGGAACEQGDVNILNCIIWRNESPVGSEIYLRNSGVMFLSYSDVEGGEGSVYVEPNSVLEWGSGNVDMEPEFVEMGYWDANGTAGDVNDDFWVEGDYRLMEVSPCIDAGDPNYVEEPGETDLDGNPRVFGDRVDMGAYEFTIFNTAPVACIVGGDRIVEAGAGCEGRVVLDGSCSSDADSTEGTNDDINDFDWYEVIDACEPNGGIYIGSGEVIECNLGLGEHLIVLEVTDKAGAFDSNEVVITVVDVTPPEFSLVVEPNILWPPNGKMVEVRAEWEVSDNCDEEVEVSLIGITMSAAGDINDYVQIGDDGSIYLRARKSKGGGGRIYTLTYEAVDDSGNIAEASATVRVPHRKGPVKRRGKSFSSLGGRLWRLLYRGGGQGR